MFIEVRKHGKKKKFYLVHSYRVGDKVKRITRYLGSDLDKKTLEKLRNRAEQLINEQIKEIHLELTKDEIKYYKNFDSKIEIVHLNKKEWLRFTEKFTYNTNAIEGSAVAYNEVKDLIEHKQEPETYDEQETLNVAKAVEFIKNTKDELSLELIKKLHKICFKETKSFAGKFRKV